MYNVYAYSTTIRYLEPLYLVLKFSLQFLCIADTQYKVVVYIMMFCSIHLQQSYCLLSWVTSLLAIYYYTPLTVHVHTHTHTHKKWSCMHGRMLSIR